jgi:hypothetical protein
LAAKRSGTFDMRVERYPPVVAPFPILADTGHDPDR